MFVRAAICLTIFFFAGAALAEEANNRVALAIGEPVQETEKGGYVPRPEAEDLIREGNKRMREGDILGARQSYQNALASGDDAAAAALVMGRSYDPIYFARIAEKNAGPDPAKAFEWYQRAMDAGAVQTAAVRIEDLKNFLAK